MKIAAAIEKMTDFYKGNIHDIYHFLKVWAFAKNIGEAEGLDPKTQETLEMAAVVHDIACPLCREKYGNTSGKHQEEESAPLVAEFFKDVPAGELDVERITWLVTHHHTYTNVEGMDYQTSRSSNATTAGPFTPAMLIFTLFGRRFRRSPLILLPGISSSSRRIK